MIAVAERFQVRASIRETASYVVSVLDEDSQYGQWVDAQYQIELTPAESAVFEARPGLLKGVLIAYGVHPNEVLTLRPDQFVLKPGFLVRPVRTQPIYDEF